jgi:hypothetical protein
MSAILFGFYKKNASTLLDLKTLKKLYEKINNKLTYNFD